jgi:hypothetical protein
MSKVSLLSTSEKNIAPIELYHSTQTDFNKLPATPIKAATRPICVGQGREAIELNNSFNLPPASQLCLFPSETN